MVIQKTPLIKDPQSLIRILKLAEIGGTRECRCSLACCAGWDSVTESAWPKEQLSVLATLRDPSIDEPTFEEYEPSSLRVDDPQAKISITHFPYNRCDVFSCSRCQQSVMRYTEYGGYYIDHRARRVQAGLVLTPL